MKFSSKIEKCGLSPMRKFAPYANEAAKKGKKLYHLNIGQPDIATPAAYFEAVKNFSQPVLAYAPSDGVPEMIDAVVNYYGKIDAPITNKQVLITTGGSEALQIALSCILDEGDEIIIPEPFYPKTFMYYEMEILDWICRQEGSVVRYDPSISVLHYQYVASKMEYRSIVRRSKFVIDCLLDSLDAAEELILASEPAEPAAAQPVNTVALADA